MAVFLAEIAMNLTDCQFNIKNLKSVVYVASELNQRYSRLEAELNYCFKQRYFGNVISCRKINIFKKTIALRLLAEFILVK